ncbi:murein transglycosylase [Bdellovibrio sp. BCCA]|uniref:murein transglycosylase n=1 Tax=Bdellovibrio sp. BCCA TaxID=3136281 RepID=UPI0030EFE46F
MKASKSFVVVALFALFFAGCAVSKNSDGMSLNPTIYYKPTIHQNKTKCSANALRDLLSPDGQVLVTLCESDYKQCLLQGSCFIEDDGKITSYNYYSTKEKIPRFIEVDLNSCPYGYGVRNSCLDPYFSAAADLKYYNAGDVIFIPRLVGAVMPNGEVHDGYIVIRDSGGGVLGANRFDFFTGFFNHLAKQNTLARLGFGDPKNRFEFRLASKAEAQAARARRNYPRLKQSVFEEGRL